jgi:hypothetical protein
MVSGRWRSEKSVGKNNAQWVVLQCSYPGTIYDQRSTRYERAVDGIWQAPIAMADYSNTPIVQYSSIPVRVFGDKGIAGNGTNQET